MGHNYLISNYRGDGLYRGMCFRNEKTMCIHGGAGVGGEPRVLVSKHMAKEQSVRIDEMDSYMCRLFTTH